MFDNLYRRVTIWLGRRTWWARLLERDHQRTTKRRAKYQGLGGGQDD